MFVAGRGHERLKAVVERIGALGGRAVPVATDTTREEEVVALFDALDAAPGVLDLVVYNAGSARWRRFPEMEAEFFESVWRVGCFGGFLVGREAARRMLPRRRGTVLFTGATASLRGQPMLQAFAAAKAGLRAMAQGMARELGPQGIHVAHVVIDGLIAGERIRKGRPELAAEKGDEGLLDLEAIAATYWHLYTQHRTAWTHEVDLRPAVEPF